MAKANELKKGMVINLNDQLLLVKHVDVKSPSSRGGNTLYKTRFSNIQTRQKVEQTFVGDDDVDLVDLDRRKVQFLYKDGEHYTFMDVENYNQYSLSEADLDEDREYLSDGLEGITALIVDEQLIGVEMPASVELEITETSPGIKGASASARTKPATVSTGLVVQVPEYLSTGERIKINTQTGKFMSRA